MLLHDAHVDHMTDGQGAVNEMQFEALRRLMLERPDGSASTDRIPLFTEVLVLVSAHSSFELALDLKDVDAQRVARMALAYKLQKRTLFFIVDPMAVETARAIKAVDPALRISVDLLNWWKIEGLPTFVTKALNCDQGARCGWPVCLRVVFSTPRLHRGTESGG